jgi:hypothetical protein
MIMCAVESSRLMPNRGATRVPSIGNSGPTQSGVTSEQAVTIPEHLFDTHSAVRGASGLSRRVRWRSPIAREATGCRNSLLDSGA